METKIIKAVFGAVKSIITQPRYRYDYGQIIEVSGITLPESFEARFSNASTGTSVRVLGQNQRVAVPDDLMRTGKSVWCYITVHDAVTDGRTMYSIRIPIRDATERTDAEPTPVQQDIISQAIAALNSAVERTAQDVESADASAQSASDSADRAETARDTAEEYVDNALEYAQQAQASAFSAASSATASASSASQAQQIKIDIESMADEAQSAAGASAQSALESAQSASQASTSATSASQSAETASTKASEASASAQTASAKATEASEYASTASQKASESSQSASAASGYATQAGQAKTAAETAQGLAEQAQSDAESAKDDAESARDTAQQIVSGISSKVEQIDQNTADIASLEADRYKAYTTDTATGTVASFSDGADDVPMVDVKVAIEPVQDLHGQENPYPAGGGVNKFKYNASVGTQIINGVTWTLYEDGSIQVSGTASGASTFHYVLAERVEDDDFYFSGNYKFYAFPANISTADFQGGVKIGSNWYSVYANEYSIALNDADGKIVEAWFQVRTNKTVNATIRPMIYPESESTPTAWSPYENICPISGWNGANVSRIGKNWFDLKKFAEVYPQTCNYNETTGELSINAASALFHVGIPTDIPLDISNGGFMQWEAMNGTGTNFRFRLTYSDGTMDNQNGTGTTTGYIKYAKQTAAKRITSIRMNWSTAGTFTIKNVCITQGTNDVPYKPYTGNLYPITFPQEAGTIYGGTLDVTTGELVVDRAIIASYAGEILPSTWISDRDVYSEGATPTTGAQVCYELATPITYQLTPQEITSLLGTNNLWADTGDSEVEYRANTELWVQRKITEAVAAVLNS